MFEKIIEDEQLNKADQEEILGNSKQNLAQENQEPFQIKLQDEEQKLQEGNVGQDFLLSKISDYQESQTSDDKEFKQLQKYFQGEIQPRKLLNIEESPEPQENLDVTENEFKILFNFWEDKTSSGLKKEKFKTED